MDALLDLLEAELQRLTVDLEASPESRAAELLRLEERAAFLRSSLAEQEDDRGRRIQATLESWARSLEELGLVHAARGAKDLVASRLEEGARAWCLRSRALAAGQAPGEQDLRSSLQSLREGFSLELALIGPGSGEEELAAELEDCRLALRKTCLSGRGARGGAITGGAEGHALAATGEFAEGTRRSQAIWALDASAEVLSSLDELDTRTASARLERCLDELEWTRTALCPEERRLRTRLDLRTRRLRAELEERGLQEVLERRLGVGKVALLERTVLVLILLVLGLLLAESLLELPAEARPWLVGIEASACTIFLVEFFLKLALVPRGRWRWFRRHFLVDLVPSIPFGLIASMDANPAHAGRIARLLRLPRIVRYVRLLQPALRALRVVTFLARGMDRLARVHRAKLNRDVVITPNRHERARARAREVDAEARLDRLESMFHQAWVELLRGLHGPAVSKEASDAAERATDRATEGATGEATGPELLARREALATLRNERLLRAAASPLEVGAVAGAGISLHETGEQRRRRAASTERTADELLAVLRSADPLAVASFLGSYLTGRFARLLRVVGVAPLRWLPVARRIVPRLERGEADEVLVARAARKLGRELARHHDRLYWFADLHGTITPSEVVDRAGTALVKSSIRPATRLLLFGSAYLLVVALLELLVKPAGGGAGELPVAEDPSVFVELMRSTVGLLERFVGTTLIVLGSVCLAVLALGSWLKRIARDATSFFEQAASAQFLGLTEAIRNRTMERDVTLLDGRVIAGEVALGGTAEQPGEEERRRELFADTVRGWLLRADARLDGIDHEPTRAAIERTVLLYRDALDGALLGESDTRSTSQLLGNPALIQLREETTFVGRAELKQLARLDLERGPGLRGPQLWFSLLSRSVARSAARLIVEYNREAIPLMELENVTEEERERHEAWLAGHPANAGPGPTLRQTEEPATSSYRTSAFTALHFLDDDPARDAAVSARFGPEVLRLVQEDRRLLYSRIFGTYPLHMRPRNERFLNVASLYDEWLGAGRVFLLPLRVLGLSLAGGGRILGSVARAVRELRDPRLRSRIDPRKGADFETAVRKIDRMRGPGVRAALWLRARLDPEYHGLPAPGLEPPRREVACAGRDLDFISADVELREQVHQQQERMQADRARLARLLATGLEEVLAGHLGAPLDPARRRALFFAYCADLEGVRGLLSAEEALFDCVELPALDEPLRRSLLLRPGLRGALREFGRGRSRTEQRRLARAVAEDRGGARQLLETWAIHGSGPGAGSLRREEGVRRLVQLLRHPTRISEQLVNLRAVQGLTLLDLLHYREHVWRLAGFEARGDSPGSLLCLDGGARSGARSR